MVRLSNEFNLIRLSSGQIEAMCNFIKKQEDVLAFYLFGSYGTEHQTELSDVDFAVLPFFKKGLNDNRELALLSGLQRIGRSDDISLINLLKAPVSLQMRILETGHLLYCADKVHLADFIEHVIRYHSDFEPDLRAFYLDYDTGLREEFL